MVGKSGTVKHVLPANTANYTFQTPEALLAVFDEYKAWNDAGGNQKFKKVQYVGKDGRKQEDASILPYSLEGFQAYCRQVGHSNPTPIIRNVDGRYQAFIEAIETIISEIKADNVTGALTGTFNANLTARIHGLADKQETQSHVHSVTEHTIDLNSLNLADLKALRAINTRVTRHEHFKEEHMNDTDKLMATEPGLALPEGNPVMDFTPEKLQTHIPETEYKLIQSIRPSDEDANNANDDNANTNDDNTNDDE